MKSTPNVKLHIVEAAFGDRHHEVTDHNNPNHLQLRTKSEIWVKENMINLAVRELLPRDWKYVAWIDCDVFFRNPNWALETIHQLQHFDIVQPWSDALDLGHQGNVLQTFKSFGLQHQRGIPKQMHPSQPYQYAHTGFAVACTRRFWEQTQGLPDYCVLGSADHHLLFGCIGEVVNTIHGKMHPTFFRKLKEWQDRALRITHKQVGFIQGRIEHMFHGPKKRRYYRERWQILIEHAFDPDKDLMYDAQGLLQLVGKPQLENEIHKYNLSRTEDSIDEY